MALSAPGLQTGFAIWPAIYTIIPTQARSKTFRVRSAPPGTVFSLGAGAVGSINATTGEYTAPASVSAPTIDTVIATGVDGSQATALVNLS